MPCRACDQRRRRQRVKESEPSKFREMPRIDFFSLSAFDDLGTFRITAHQASIPRTFECVNRECRIGKPRKLPNYYDQTSVPRLLGIRLLSAWFEFDPRKVRLPGQAIFAPPRPVRKFAQRQR